MSYAPEEQPEVEESYRKKVMYYQITMFALCYVGYGSVHVYREFWSQSKPEIEDQEDFYHCDKQTLSNIDFTNFMIYGMVQFGSGAVADEYNL